MDRRKTRVATTATMDIRWTTKNMVVDVVVRHYYLSVLAGL